MPHFTIEYSLNVQNPPDHTGLATELHELIDSFDIFDKSAVKTRILPRESFFVSDGSRGQCFVHLELAILEGRPAALKKQISAKLLAFLEKRFAGAQGQNCALSVEIRDMDAQSYSKSSFGRV